MTGILHTVNKSPFEKNSLDTCLRLSAPGCHILLIEDAVYAAIDSGLHAPDIAASMADRSFHVLGPDLQARGISTDELLAGINVVDYDGFVQLVVTSSGIQTWL